MISVGPYLINPKQVVALRVEGSILRIFMTAPIQGGGGNAIAHTADSPEKAQAMKDEIAQAVHAFIAR